MLKRAGMLITSILLCLQLCLPATSVSRTDRGCSITAESSNVIYLGGPPVSAGAAHASQSLPSACYGHGQYFVAWVDHQRGSPDLVGTRISLDGKVIDSIGIRICNDIPMCDGREIGCVQGHAVVFNGAEYLVLWAGRSKIYSACVDTLGEVVARDSADFSNSSVTLLERRLYVASDGSDFLVVWPHTSIYGDGALYAARVSPSGRLLDEEPLVISAAALSLSGKVGVTFGGGHYFVVWPDNGNIYGARITPAGVLLDTTPLAIGDERHSLDVPAVGYAANRYLVVWGPGAGVISGLRGAVLNTDGKVVRSVYGMSGYILDEPAVTTDGTDFLVTWMGKYGDVYAARVDTLGDVLVPGEITVCGDGYSGRRPATAFGGDAYLVGWQRQSDAPFSADICARRVSHAGEVLDPDNIIVSMGINVQQSADIVFNGERYLAAWTDSRAGQTYICGTVVDPGGSIVGSPGMMLVADQGEHRSSHVATDGSGFLLTWVSGATLFASVSVKALDSSGMATGGGVPTVLPALGFDEAGVAFNGGHYLLAWNTALAAGDSAQLGVVAVRLDVKGTVADSVVVGGQVQPKIIQIATEPYVASWIGEQDQRSPDVVACGDDWMVVWEHFDDESWDIRGARIDSSGLVLDPDGITISEGAPGERYPAVAFGAGQLLAVWQDGRSGSYDIYGTRISLAGEVMDPQGIEIATGMGDQVMASVEFDGTNFVVMWEDADNGSSRIRYAKVSPAGAVVPGGACGTDGRCDARAPNLCCGPWGQVLAVYDALDTSLMAPRIWGELISGEWKDVIPKYALAKGFPNPFSETVHIDFTAPQDIPTVVRVYDVRGRLVTTVFDGTAKAGPNSALWDGLSDSGERVAAGVYFIALDSPKFQASGKVVHIR